MARTLRSRLLVAGAVVWTMAVLVGLGLFARYETTAGRHAAAPATWPTDSRLPRGTGFSVVMFLHPDCPCSRATLTELAAIAETRRATFVIVFAAGGGDMWERAGQIRGVTRVVDDGREAARFGAMTSGHAVVFDAGGHVRFAGGITGSRGHAGDNVGRRAVERILAGHAATADHAVFGCALKAGAS